jgi:carbon storage regulator
MSGCTARGKIIEKRFQETGYAIWGVAVSRSRHRTCFWELVYRNTAYCRVRISFSYDNRENPMLVLSRKLGEKIVIGDNIVVTVVKIDRNQIRIGIEAPHDVPVYREEIAPQRAGKPTLEEMTV